jgi:predicted metalloprotease
VHTRFRRWVRAAAIATVAALALSACASTVNGDATIVNSKNANLDVIGGDSTSSFDQSVQNSLSDIEAFWKINYPKVSGGKPLPPLKGGLYSVDGLKVAETDSVTGPAARNACISRSASFIVDNGAFCLLDDSISWDRADTHLFAQLAKHYGELMVALVFAHEFGHAISYRLGVFDQRPQPETIFTESQADCAAGAWAASALKRENPHFRDVTAQTIDDALEGYLDGRDSTPGTINEISHGNGFDRLSALADGIDKGVTYCYSKNYFDRTFTERPFESESDYNAGGNASLAQSTDPNGFVVKDLNRFWTGAAGEIGKTLTPVRIAVAEHPKCGTNTSALLGYCPDDNTVYFSTAFAAKAYNSLPGVAVDKSTGNVSLLFNQPADFSLGVLFAIGWGMAVRHQFFGRELDDKAALLSAICYTGAYAKDVNLAVDPNYGTPKAKDLLLSPADLDEAVSALLNQQLMAGSYGERGSTGLDRVQAFVKGYKGGLASC